MNFDPRALLPGRRDAGEAGADVADRDFDSSNKESGDTIVDAMVEGKSCAESLLPRTKITSRPKTMLIFAMVLYSLTEAHARRVDDAIIPPQQRRANVPIALPILTPHQRRVEDGIVSPQRRVPIVQPQPHDDAIAPPRQRELKTLRPNIIFILADDMGYGEVEQFPATSPHGRISTPHLRKFGESGMTFTNAYAGYHTCAPSRTALMTGYHSGHFLRENVRGRIPYNKITTQAMLQKAGYTTAGIGKMAPLYSATAQGFDYFIGQMGQAQCHNMYPRTVDAGNGTRNVNLSLNWALPSDPHAARTACMANPHRFNYTVDITHQRSMAWIRQHVRSQRARHTPRVPFYLYQSYTVPHAGGWGHAPVHPMHGAPVPTNGQYADQKAWPDVERDHASVITYMDTCVGELMALLHRLAIAEETVVFFASDNGAHNQGGHKLEFFDSTGGLRGHKHYVYEGGVRSPSMVRWPGTIKPGVVSHLMWAFWDFMATAAELAGVEAPAGIDGVSIVPTLMGRPQERKPFIFFTWKETRTHRKIMMGYGVRVGQWKGVVHRCHHDQPSDKDIFEIYNLAKDPFEKRDLSNTTQGVKQIAALLAVVKANDISCRTEP